MSKELIDLTGKTFNHWTVIKRGANKITKGGQNKTYWVSKCSCGVIKDVYMNSLISGSSKSCGHNRGKEPGYSGKRSAFNLYKTGARQRNLDFNINFEQFIDISSKNCFYCDTSPFNIGRGMKGIYYYSGLDRVNNDIGYTLDNIVPCCKNCNLAKRQLTQNDFFELIKKIYEKHCK